MTKIEQSADSSAGREEVFDVCDWIRRRLFEMQDISYHDFQSKLMPTVDSKRVIGVRTPDLRRFAKEAARHPQIPEFLAALPHEYYEENNLHAFLIELIKDYEQTIEALDVFLPYVDNWATCDMMSPKILGENRERLLEKIREWIASGETYTVRFGVGMLMRFYLDDAFSPEYLQMVAEIRSEEYYVKMMAAWYFATAFVSQRDAVLPYFEERRLEPWTHNKAIQKAVESRRVSPEDKAYLRTLKIK